MRLRETFGSEKRPPASFRMGNREEPSRDDVLLSMVCPALEAMKRNPPPLVDAEPSESTPSGPRSSAVSSAAPNSLGPEPGMACRTCGRSLRPSRTGNGVAALVLDVACGILPQVPRSTRAAQGGSIPLGGAAPGLAPRWRVFGVLSSWRASCSVRLFGLPFFFFRQPLCGGSKLLGTI